MASDASVILSRLAIGDNAILEVQGAELSADLKLNILAILRQQGVVLDHNMLVCIHVARNFAF